MIPRDEWVWWGTAGHFCASARCRFRMHTHVGRYCVSTVGDYHPAGNEDGEPETIGVGRLYETMVFVLGDDGDPVDWNGVGMAPYNDEQAAQSGHIAMCERYAQREQPK